MFRRLEVIGSMKKIRSIAQDRIEDLLLLIFADCVALQYRASAVVQVVGSCARLSHFVSINWCWRKRLRMTWEPVA